MTQRISYTKMENELWPEYRDRLNKSESTEDVKKFFAYTATELLEKVLEPRGVRLEIEDVRLDPEGDNSYILSSRLSNQEEVSAIFAKSDLQDILQRLARSAVKRYRQLTRNAGKPRSGTFYR